jgi:hypothetical protein
MAGTVRENVGVGLEGGAERIEGADDRAFSRIFKHKADAARWLGRKARRRGHLLARGGTVD